MKKFVPMYYCKKCKEFVPNKKKHDNKRHSEIKSK